MTRRVSTGRIVFGAALVAAFGFLSFLGLRQGDAASASGCCSRHGGVCDCACCDGTALSDTCRSRIPACGGENTAAAETAFSGKVIKVADGDTLDVLRGGKSIRIRLAEIDCPEKTQPFGTKAKQLTAALSAGKTVTVRVVATDRYGRTVARVILPDGRSLNESILRAGLAWWYRDYSKDERLGKIESEARAAGRGLWADPDPVPPWVYRRQHR